MKNDSCTQFKVLYLEKFCVKLNISNAGIMVNNKVCKALYIVQYDKYPEVFVMYHSFEVYEDLYEYPLKSGFLGIYKVLL